MSRITISGDPTVHEYINRNAETDNMHPAILRSEIEARPLRPRTYVPNSLPLTNTAGKFHICLQLTVLLLIYDFFLSSSRLYTKPYPKW